MRSGGGDTQRTVRRAKRPGSAQAGDRPTKAQAIHERLADDIVHGRLLPGTALDEAAIACQLGVSRTPIREAIRLLEAGGLIAVRPRRGAVVARVGEGELDDMFAVMAEMESLCARWAALAMTPAERRRLEDLHEAGRALVRAGDVPTYAALNTRFHEAIYEGAHNLFLTELTLQVRRRCAPFRRVQFEEMGRLGRSHAEHGRVLDALMRADPEGAAAAMRAHLLVVRSAVEGTLPTDKAWRLHNLLTE